MGKISCHHKVWPNLSCSISVQLIMNAENVRSIWSISKCMIPCVETRIHVHAPACRMRFLIEIAEISRFFVGNAITAIEDLNFIHNSHAANGVQMNEFQYMKISFEISHILHMNAINFRVSLYNWFIEFLMLHICKWLHSDYSWQVAVLAFFHCLMNPRSWNRWMREDMGVFWGHPSVEPQNHRTSTFIWSYLFFSIFLLSLVRFYRRSQPSVWACLIHRLHLADTFLRSGSFSTHANRIHFENRSIIYIAWQCLQNKVSDISVLGAEFKIIFASFRKRKWKFWLPNVHE